MTDSVSTSVRLARRRWFVAVAAAAAVLDLATKATASALLPRRIVDLPGPLDLQLAHNPGVAFGLGDALPAWLLLALTTGIAVFLAVAGWRRAFASPVAAGLVLGGAVANIIDRLQGGSVIDMLHLGWWPTFNLADVWITVGAALLVLVELRGATRTTPASKPKPSGGSSAACVSAPRDGHTESGSWGAR